MYGTLSLGPLLYITGDRVTTVNALAVPGGKFAPDVTFPTLHVLQMATTGGSSNALLRSAPRPAMVSR